MATKADAWEEGWEACANYLQDAECDPEHWDRFHVNPYANEPKSTARPPHPDTMAGK